MGWSDILVPSSVICGLFGVMLVVGIGFSYLWLVRLNKEATKCPECGKRGAGELVESKVIDSKAHWEWRRHISIFRQDVRRVQVTEETYEDHYECQYCGHQWTKTAQWTRTTPEKKRTRH
jgi:ribosomal protein L37AE/L43A